MYNPKSGTMMTHPLQPQHNLLEIPKVRGRHTKLTWWQANPTSSWKFGGIRLLLLDLINWFLMMVDWQSKASGSIQFLRLIRDYGNTALQRRTDCLLRGLVQDKIYYIVSYFIAVLGVSQYFFEEFLCKLVSSLRIFLDLSYLCDYMQTLYILYASS